ncbi:MAG: nucleotide-binding protein [Phycisphaeraceae bacterium]|nr:nucleotide-binding protein [Phycisphaeraceae bacterium]
MAALLAEHGELVEFQPGQTIIEQGAADNTVYFILTGVADVFVNNRAVAARGPRETIGEMAVIEPAAPRSATVKARDAVTVLKLAGETFESIAEQTSGSLWKAASRILAERLRQREKFHRPANPMPVLFLGSSVEGLSVAREVQQQLKHDPLVVKIWTTGVFGPSGIPVDDLIRQVSEADFALFVFGPDDKIASRDQQYQGPRDNVVFELGLFMGKLGRERVFLMRQHGGDLKIPTDLLGVTPITYVCREGCSLADELGPACHELRQATRKLGAI